MTAAIWMAVPPEAHSALLSDGPGPGTLLAAAATWHELSTEYAAAAAEVSAVVAAVRSGAWEGAAADSWVAAHGPYVAWLLDASTNSAAAAAQHESAAAAYTAALAAMPTLAELALNHTAHAALLATNFFGINTVPIAVNESDYARMWIQAATTMSGYQAASAAAVASTPQPAPAPQIVSPAASLDPGRALLNLVRPFLVDTLGIDPLIRNPLVSNPVTELIADILEYFGVYWDPGSGILNGVGYEEYADATQPMWYLARGLELIGDSMQMSQNPAQALQYFVALSVFDWPTHIAQLGTAITQSPLLFAAVGGAMLVPVAGASGFAGLAGLAGLPHPDAAPTLPGPASASTSLPAAGMTSSAPSLASASGTASAPTAAPAPAHAGAAPPAAPAAPASSFPPYAVAPPGIGFGSGMSSRASARAQRKAPEPDDAAVAATSSAAARRQARARARARTGQRGYGDEFMDMDGPAAIAGSDQGAGPLGRAGLAHKATEATKATDATEATEATEVAKATEATESTEVAEAAGLTTLAADEFDGGPRVPMVPSTWR